MKSHIKQNNPKISASSHQSKKKTGIVINLGRNGSGYFFLAPPSKGQQQTAKNPEKMELEQSETQGIKLAKIEQPQDITLDEVTALFAAKEYDKGVTKLTNALFDLLSQYPLQADLSSIKNDSLFFMHKIPQNTYHIVQQYSSSNPELVQRVINYLILITEGLINSVGYTELATEYLLLAKVFIHQMLPEQKLLAYHLLGEAQFRRGYFQKALSYFQEARALLVSIKLADAKIYTLLMSAHQTLLNLNMLNEASLLLQELTSKVTSPNSTLKTSFILFYEGQQALHTKNYTLALEKFNKVLISWSNPKNGIERLALIDCYHACAKAQVELRNIKSAIDNYENACKLLVSNPLELLHPIVVDINYELALLYAYAANEKAVKCIKVAARVSQRLNKAKPYRLAAKVTIALLLIADQENGFGIALNEFANAINSIIPKSKLELDPQISQYRNRLNPLNLASDNMLLKFVLFVLGKLESDPSLSEDIDLVSFYLGLAAVYSYPESPDSSRAIFYYNKILNLQNLQPSNKVDHLQRAYILKKLATCYGQLSDNNYYYQIVANEERLSLLKKYKDLTMRLEYGKTQLALSKLLCENKQLEKARATLEEALANLKTTPGLDGLVTQLTAAYTQLNNKLQQKLVAETNCDWPYHLTALAKLEKFASLLLVDPTSSIPVHNINKYLKLIATIDQSSFKLEQAEQLMRSLTILAQACFTSSLYQDAVSYIIQLEAMATKFKLPLNQQASLLKGELSLLTADYTTAVQIYEEQFRSLLKSAQQKDSLTLLAQYYVKLVEALLELSRFAEVNNLITELASFKSQLDSELSKSVTAAHDYSLAILAIAANKLEDKNSLAKLEELAKLYPQAAPNQKPSQEQIACILATGKVHLNSANTKVAAEYFDQAKLMLEKLYDEHSPYLAPVVYLSALCSIEQGDYSQARDKLLAAVRLLLKNSDGTHPNLATYYTYVAICYAMDGDGSKLALEYLSQALSSAFPEAKFRLAQIHDDFMSDRPNLTRNNKLPYNQQFELAKQFESAAGLLVESDVFASTNPANFSLFQLAFRTIYQSDSTIFSANNWHIISENYRNIPQIQPKLKDLPFSLAHYQARLVKKF